MSYALLRNRCFCNSISYLPEKINLQENGDPRPYPLPKIPGTFFPGFLAGAQMAHARGAMCFPWENTLAFVNPHTKVKRPPLAVSLLWQGHKRLGRRVASPMCFPWENTLVFVDPHTKTKSRRMATFCFGRGTNGSRGAWCRYVFSVGKHARLCGSSYENKRPPNGGLLFWQGHKGSNSGHAVLETAKKVRKTA